MAARAFNIKAITFKFFKVIKRCCLDWFFYNVHVFHIFCSPYSSSTRLMPRRKFFTAFVSDGVALKDTSLPCGCRIFQCFFVISSFHPFLQSWLTNFLMSPHWPMSLHAQRHQHGHAVNTSAPVGDFERAGFVRIFQHSAANFTQVLHIEACAERRIT